MYQIDILGAAGAVQGVCGPVHGGHQRGRPARVLLQVWRGHGRLYTQTVQGFLLHHVPRPRGSLPTYFICTYFVKEVDTMETFLEVKESDQIIVCKRHG